MENKYTVDDMVASAINQKPSEFENSFADIMIDRIRTAVENKKVEIAQQMYGYQPEPEHESEEYGDYEEEFPEGENDYDETT